MTSRARSRPTRPGLFRALSTRLASSRSVVDRMPFIAPRTRVSRTRARVSTPSMPMMPCLVRKRFKRFLGAEVAHPAAELANHEASDPGATALQILVVDPVIADFGVGHRHDLTVIGGVGQDLLITRHARVEDDLAIDLAPGAKGPAGKDRTVLEREFRRVHRHHRGRSAATPEPGCLIQTTQSYPVRCSCVESRPRGRPGPFRFRSGIGSVF